MTRDIPTGWEGILDEGEAVLWQGRPDAAVIFRIEKAFQFIFGLFFAGFALFWMVMAGAMGGGYFWMFGLLHFGVGIAISFGALFKDAYRRRYTFYTLTSKRAFIATDMPHKGQHLESYPITPDTALTYIPGALATVNFATKDRRSGKNHWQTEPIGFERITDGDTVYRQMREIQQGRDNAK